jgi:ketosteroid isomerase-like protein
MTDTEREIEEMVHRETRAWDRKDADALVAIFHPDMVWPWPPDADSHDPALWVMELGRFDAARWRRGWQELFDTHELVHNRRRIVKIVVSRENDGAFAVVDVDTLWRDAEGRDFRWKGRACKVYTKLKDGWKLIAHTGLLDYGA